MAALFTGSETMLTFSVRMGFQRVVEMGYFRSLLFQCLSSYENRG